MDSDLDDYLVSPNAVRQSDFLADTALKPGDDIDGFTVVVPEDGQARMNKWATIEGAWIFGYPMFDWADVSTPIDAFDPANGGMTFRYYTYGGYREGGSYYLYNVPEELDAPGEWHYDAETGFLDYLPRPGEDPSSPSFRAIAAHACELVRLEADPVASGRAVRNVSFRDIVFRGRNAIGSEQVRTYLERGCNGRLATENVRFENWTADCWGRAFDVFVDPGVRLPRFGGLTFQNGRFGYASAMGTIIMIVILILTFFQRKLTKGAD